MTDPDMNEFPALQDSTPEMAVASPVRHWLERRRIVLGVAAVLCVTIVVLRAVVPDNRDDHLGLLFVIPVAMVGLELGIRAGLAAALGMLAIVVFLPSDSELSLDAVGISMYGVVFMSVGALAGNFSDRMWTAQRHLTRLLAVERERAALQGDLEHAHRRLDEQIRNAGHVLDHHEQERRVIARELHEQSAQTMAAALLVVGRLERDIVDDLTQTQLDRVRDSMHACIAELRRLAGSLRSPVLEELGLLVALERLCEREQEERKRTVDLRVQRLSELSADVEISAYRVIEDTFSAYRFVEDALEASTANILVSIDVDEDAQSLRITIDGGLDCAACRRELEAQLATARARLEMIGGALRCYETGEGIAVSAEFLLTSPIRADGAYSGGVLLEDTLQHTHPSAS